MLSGIPLYDSASDLASGETAYVGTDENPVLYRRPADGAAAVAVSGGAGGYATVWLIGIVQQTGTTYTWEEITSTLPVAYTFDSAALTSPARRQLTWAFDEVLNAVGGAIDLAPTSVTNTVRGYVGHVGTHTAEGGTDTLVFDMARVTFIDDASTFAPTFRVSMFFTVI